MNEFASSECNSDRVIRVLSLELNGVIGDCMVVEEPLVAKDLRINVEVLDTSPSFSNSNGAENDVFKLVALFLITCIFGELLGSDIIMVGVTGTSFSLSMNNDCRSFHLLPNDEMLALGVPAAFEVSLLIDRNSCIGSISFDLFIVLFRSAEDCSTAPLFCLVWRTLRVGAGNKKILVD